MCTLAVFCAAAPTAALTLAPRSRALTRHCASCRSAAVRETEGGRAKETTAPGLIQGKGGGWTKQIGGVRHKERDSNSTLDPRRREGGGEREDVGKKGKKRGTQGKTEEKKGKEGEVESTIRRIRQIDAPYSVALAQHSFPPACPHFPDSPRLASTPRPRGPAHAQGVHQH